MCLELLFPCRILCNQEYTGYVCGIDVLPGAEFRSPPSPFGWIQWHMLWWFQFIMQIVVSRILKLGTFYLLMNVNELIRKAALVIFLTSEFCETQLLFAGNVHCTCKYVYI